MTSKRQKMEEQSEIKCSAHHFKTSQEFYAMMKEKKMTDCYLFAGANSVACHRIILSASSRFFKRVIEFNMKREPLIILSNEITLQDLDALVEFMYTGRCVYPSNKIDRFLEIGRKLEIVALDEKSTVPDISEEIDSSAKPTAATKAKAGSSTKSRTKPKDQLKEKVKDKVFKKISQDPAGASGSTPRRSLPTRGRSVPSKTRSVSLSPIRSQPAKRRKPSVLKRETCGFCSKLYLNEKGCKKHEQECLMNPSRAMKVCSVCQTVLKPSAMSRHMKRFHDMDLSLNLSVC